MKNIEDIIKGKLKERKLELPDDLIKEISTDIEKNYTKITKPIFTSCDNEAFNLGR